MVGSNNKTIAKNTIFLYIRTFAIMIISLYTSRVILQVLGIDDFGIYQTVGGIVGFLSFINSALGTGTSRFLTFAIGDGNKNKLFNTFSTTLTVHLILALIIVALGESIGLWYFNNKMVIPDNRFAAATWVFHLSMVIAIISIVSVPFNAAIIAHERMKVFAYVGIVESVCKLAVVYALTVGCIDKLVLYAVLLLLIQTSFLLFYLYYCRKSFEEAKFISIKIDKHLFKEIFSFSGWSLFANGAIALNSQGILLLLNYFFAPAVVTARTISLQVYNAANQFVSNFRTAANPQIVKQLASGDIEGSHRLLLQSTKFSYYLMLFLCLPICLLASPILNIWLVEVPEYTVAFLQLVVIQSLFQVFDTSFYTALYAKGKIKENALISPTLGFLRFPIVFLLFKEGFSPLALSWASLITYAVLGCIVKPMLIFKVADYSLKDVYRALFTCFLVTTVAVPVPLVFYFMLDIEENILNDAILLVVCLTSVAASVWFLGLTKNMKRMLLTSILARLSWKN